MSRKEFEKELEKLQVELVKMQEWVKDTGAKICVLFEGRDTAGKGGIIKRITERTSPRVFRVVALPSPTEREKSQMYFQRYMPHLPAAGEVVLFDRSWYNRAGVERVMGFATEEQVEYFLKYAPPVERAIIDSGIILIKYWLEETMEDQTERFEERIDDYRKIWKLSPMDLESHRRWYDYSRARDAMFAATDTPESPWYVVDSHDQRRARLNCITHLLSLIPYEEVPHEPVKLPKRQAEGRLRGAGLSVSAYVPRNTERRGSTSWQNTTAESTEMVYADAGGRLRKQLKVDPAKGLSAAEAQQRLQQYGPNELADKKKESGWQAFLRQYQDFMQIILLGAAVVNLVVTGEVGTTIVLVGPDGLQRGAGPARRIQGRGQPGRAGRR